jgi:WhiB family transcriptional regulator, redox-sensing transcriptional regulator
MKGPQAQLAPSRQPGREIPCRQRVWGRLESGSSSPSGSAGRHNQAGYPGGCQASWGSVLEQARCARSTLDPDEWFPASARTGPARQEAAAAIAVCTECPVQTECLELSLAHWTIGQHGIWGGLVPAERAAMRQVARSPGHWIISGKG